MKIFFKEESRTTIILAIFELKKEKIIVELRDLINKADEFKDDVDCYCEFMRETFLATSGLN